MTAPSATPSAQPAPSHPAAPLPIAITTGEPAGIGPDITIRAVLELAGGQGGPRFHVLGDARLLAERAAALGLEQAWQGKLDTGEAAVEDIPLAAPCTPGVLDARNGRHVLALLDAALAGLLPQPGQPPAMRRWSPHRCRRAPSMTPACPSPAIPNIWPSGPAYRAW
ncbi:hypothetical protein OJJOAM_002534 [Cupriavidus sp. H18C1]